MDDVAVLLLVHEMEQKETMAQIQSACVPKSWSRCDLQETYTTLYPSDPMEAAF